MDEAAASNKAWRTSVNLIFCSKKTQTFIIVD